MANVLTKTDLERLRLNVACGLAAKLLQVSSKLIECVHNVSMIIFEVDKYSHFLCLSAKCKHRGNES